MTWSKTTRIKCSGHCYFLLLIDAVYCVLWTYIHGVRRSMDRTSRSCKGPEWFRSRRARSGFSFKSMVDIETWGLSRADDISLTVDSDDWARLGGSESLLLGRLGLHASCFMLGMLIRKGGTLRYSRLLNVRSDSTERSDPRPAPERMLYLSAKITMSNAHRHPPGIPAGLH